MENSDRFYSEFKEILLKCSYTSTYKFSWAKALIELSIKDNNTHEYINITFNSIVRIMFKYYWNLYTKGIVDNTYMGLKTEIGNAIEELAKKYVGNYGKIENYDTAINKINGEDYNRCIEEMETAVSKDVCDRFTISKGIQQDNIYVHESGDKYITMKKSHMNILKESCNEFYKIINYRWATTVFNISNGIRKKVLVEEEFEVNRSVENIELFNADNYYDKNEIELEHENEENVIKSSSYGIKKETILQLIEERIQDIIVDSKTIYVLKGFNSLYNDINIEVKHIMNLNIDDSIINIFDNNVQKLLFQTIDVLKEEKPCFCFMEELLTFNKIMPISSIIKNLKYEVEIIEIGCFDYYYPGFKYKDNSENELITERIANDEKIQNIYRYFEIIKNKVVVAYNDMDIIKENDIPINYLFDGFDDIEKMKNRYINLNNTLSIDKTISKKSFIALFDGALSNEFNSIQISKNNIDDSSMKFLSILNEMGIDIHVK